MLVKVTEKDENTVYLNINRCCMLIQDKDTLHFGFSEGMDRSTLVKDTIFHILDISTEKWREVSLDIVLVLWNRE